MSVRECQIEHLFSEKRFRVVGVDPSASLDYERRGKTLHFMSTFVPEHQRGQGLAEKLCLVAFQYADSSGCQVVPVCSYIRDTFLGRFPEWKRLVP